MPGFDQPAPFPSDDYAFRTLVGNVEDQKRRIDDVVRLLGQFNEENLYAFDESGNPFGWAMLARRGGSWPGIKSQSTLAALQPASDVSDSSDAKITITYGTYGGAIPTISGTALVPATASNIITLGTSDEVVYMQCDFTFNTSTGVITVVDAEITSATATSYAGLTSSISGSSGTLYQALFGVTITAPVGAGPYTIIAAPGVGGSQNFGICNPSATPSISGPFGV